MKKPNLIGARNHTDHESPDFDLYTTSQEAVQKFIDTIKEDGFIDELPKEILEPCAGLNDITKVLIDNGFNVWSCDLVDRSDWESFQGGRIDVKDFLMYDFENVNCIITNPPYSHAEEFVRRGLKVVNDGGYVIMLLRIQFLESKSRYKMFVEEGLNPKYVYIHSSRIDCYMNGDKSRKNSMMAFAWYVWEKGRKGETIVRFIK